jgi:hypothetical protein
MLSGDVDRYIGLRRTLGYKLRSPERHLRAFVVTRPRVARRTFELRRS